MESINSDRHAHILAALRNPLTSAAHHPRLTPGAQARAKRLLREVRAAYALTHDHLSQIATAVPVGQPVAQEVIGGARRFILEQNLQDALALAARARALPLTRTGAAVRTAALDNVSVAQEACDVAQAHPITTTLADLLREIRLLCPAATQVALNWTGQADETPVFARPQRDRRVILLVAGTQPVGTVWY
ncbi:hypothetical protein CBQ26_14315 [Deinococcus indicus]|uniref:Uncharacterized protein n=1 Tax=Deinococcus indicus TaxID=223556 RepID=A0A246BHG6_9DEIO|nr:hypothetical protein [Deinococcus indicus]OWL94690.1 hypothetical protein CBQ26_14315 [Deinococcus indicus]